MIDTLEKVKDLVNCSVQDVRHVINSGEGWEWDDIQAELSSMLTELEEASELLGGTNYNEDDEAER